MSGANVANNAGKVAAPYTKQESIALGEGFGKAVNCQTADCLRALPLDKILAEQSPFTVNRPMIDGNIIPMSFIDAFKQGKFNPLKTFINGNMRDEGTFFTGTYELMTGKAMDESAYRKEVRAFFGNDTDKILAHYPSGAYANAGEAYAAVFTDGVLACSALKTNELLSDKTKVYAYEFADRTAPGYLPVDSTATNASHTYEIPYLFRGFHGSSDMIPQLNAHQTELSDHMIAVWMGSANLDNVAPQWRTFDKNKENVYHFVLPQSRTVEGQFSKLHHCDFWKEIGVQ